MNNNVRGALSVVEAAKYLGIGRSMAYEAVRNGEIPARRIGNRWIIPIADLNRWMGEKSSDTSAQLPE